MVLRGSGGVMIRAGEGRNARWVVQVVCVGLKKEGLGFLQSILVLRAVEEMPMIASTGAHAE